MADRAAEREDWLKLLERDEWTKARRRAVAAEWELQSRMTLGEARELLAGPSWACACRGFPNCCLYRWDQARALHRAAHIAAKLMAARADGGEET